MTPTKLRNLRRSRGETQTGLAMQLGVTLRTIQRWEKGETPIPGPAARLLSLIKAREEDQGEN